MAIIQADNLSKTYGKTEALKSFDLTIDAGKVIGLIGRNGAGKTTLMNLIAGLIPETAGTIKINNEPVFNNIDAISNIAFARESIPFDEDLRLKNVFEIAACTYEGWDQEQCERLTNKFNLDTKKRIKKLSKGMKTMVSLIVVFSSGCKVLMFDEPTEGLDAAYRKMFYQLVIDVISKDDSDKTILISSHLLSELQLLLEEIVLIDEGQLVKHADMEYFMNCMVELEGKVDEIASVTEGKRIYHKQQLHEKVRVIMERTDLSDSDFNKIDNTGIRFNPVSPQDACIYLGEGVMEVTA